MSVESTYELGDTVDACDAKSLWVFGYGSLCWRPGFRFDKAVIGYVRGFTRKFWQGNTTHRGTISKPGRVATLIEDDKGCAHGVAFALSGEAAIPYLQQRECTLGGYITHFTTFYPLGDFGSTTSTSSNPQVLRVLVYIATPKNDLWLGDAPSSNIARQIAESRGDSGHNAEYLIRLANFMREHCPECVDEHLFEIEREMRRFITEDLHVDLEALMGDGSECISYNRKSRITDEVALEPQVRREEIRADTFQFSARVPDKQLRCLNI